MQLQAKSRLAAQQITAHLHELNDVLDKQSIVRLTKLESYGEFVKLDFANPKYVSLHFKPYGKARATKMPAVDINGLAAMTNALHGLIAEITPTKDLFILSIKI